MVYDIVEYDFRITTNTLLMLFAAFQMIVIGLLADLVVRVTRSERGGATRFHVTGASPRSQGAQQ